ncbi:MAG: hypothetical protein K0S76_777 [Herbinix sp.]|jgi:dTDP-4-dehydrorhamnose reductase|nr:hypothetical protein [Herbinix sp.]
MERVLITGASGQLGLTLNQLLTDNKDYELYLTKTRALADGMIKGLDLTDRDAIYALVEEIKPDIIINCAAMTAVDLCESEPDKAYQINALGPKYLAEAANQSKAKLIHISSDYVFDGAATEPFTEDSKTNPISVYGKTKLAGDEFITQTCKRYFILRTAWVYGEGRNFVKTMLKLSESGNKIRVVADQIGTPTSALELARVIVRLMKTDCYGIYNASCEGSTSWYEFARTIFLETGIKAEVEPIPTTEYPTPAKRPMYSVLDNRALREKLGYFMMDWKEALKEYLNSNGNREVR